MKAGSTALVCCLLEIALVYTNRIFASTPPNSLCFSALNLTAMQLRHFNVNIRFERISHNKKTTV